MKSLAKAVMLILLLFNAGVLISSASPPPLPNTFSGTVKFANTTGEFDAPIGTLIEALIDNVIKGSTTVITAGRYMIGVSGTYDDLDKNITFKVDNVIAEQKAAFNASSPPPRTLNLIITPIKGDFNGDGRTTLYDVIYLLNVYAGTPGYTLTIPEAGDFNGDSRITLYDVIYLLNVYAGTPGYTL